MCGLGICWGPGRAMLEGHAHQEATLLMLLGVVEPMDSDGEVDAERYSRALARDEVAREEAERRRGANSAGERLPEKCGSGDGR